MPRAAKTAPARWLPLGRSRRGRLVPPVDGSDSSPVCIDQLFIGGESDLGRRIFVSPAIVLPRRGPLAKTTFDPRCSKWSHCASISHAQPRVYHDTRVLSEFAVQ